MFNGKCGVTGGDRCLAGSVEWLEASGVSQEV